MSLLEATEVSRDLLLRVRTLFDAPIRVEDAVARLRTMHDAPEQLLTATIDAGVNGLTTDLRATFRAARATRVLARELGWDVARGRAWSIVGQAFIAAHRARRSLGPLRRARAAFRRADEPRWFHITGVRMVFPLTQVGRWDDAERIADAAIDYFEVNGPSRDAVSARIARALMEQRRENYGAALRRYRRVRRDLAVVPPGDSLHDVVATNVSVALEGRQRYRAAERHLRGLEDSARTRGDVSWAAAMRANRAHLDAIQGRLHAALDGYVEAEVEFEALHMPRAVAQCQLERAEFVLQMSLVELARDLAARAARVFADFSLDKESGQAHHLIAAADLLDGRPERALRALRVARHWFEGSRFVARTGDVDLLTSVAYEQLGELEEARRFAQRAHETFLRIGDVERAARADVVLGRLDLADGLPSRALDHAAAAWNRLRSLPAPGTRVEIESLRAQAHLVRGDADARLAALRRAVTALEAQRGLMPPGEFRIAFLAPRASLYSEIVAALADSGWAREAFEYVERAKSRTLVDLLAGRSVPRGARRAGSGLRSQRIRHERGRLDALYSRLHAGAPDVSPDAVRELEGRLSSLLRDEWLRDPELASISSVGVVPLSDVQRCVDERTLLLEYFVTPDRIYAFVVRSDRLDMVAIDVARGDLEQMIRRFRFHRARQRKVAGSPRLQADVEVEAVRANLAALHAVLIDPLEHLLDRERLVIAAHGALHALPFHALPDGDGWLCDRYEVSYVPSLSVYAFCSRKTASATGPATVLALADEQAPAIAQDAQSVAQALGPTARCITGEAATLEAFKDAAVTSRVLHLATHGMYRADRPELSSVRLADRWLNAYDVYDLDIRSELVTLAACESGVAAVTDGDEVLGLLRGFLFAGAPRVLAGQWRVDDGVTAEFMRVFYAAAHSTGSWGAALRTAMQSVRERHAHPFFWAPFFLVGHPGQAPNEGLITDHVRAGGDAGDNEARDLR